MMRTPTLCSSYQVHQRLALCANQARKEEIIEEAAGAAGVEWRVISQGQVFTVADQDPFCTGPIKLKKTRVLMCTKHHINGFVSGTSKRVKFVENVLCSQKCNLILCGNIFIVCSCVFLVL